MKTTLTLLLLLTSLTAMAQPPQPFTHVVLILQENRTIDNLFGGTAWPGADIVQIGTSERLAASVELPHTHTAWVKNYTNGAWPAGSKHFINPIDVQPYYQIAQQFGFANRMFQTNQGPSAPAHQFLFSGTSEPSVGSNLLESENPSGAPCAVGTVSEFIDPDGLMHQLSACMDHGTIADLATGTGLTWRYYAEPSGIGVNLWNPAEAIRHICMASGQMTGGSNDGRTVQEADGTAGMDAIHSGSDLGFDANMQVATKTICTGPAYTANVVLNPPQVLIDIAAGNLANITFITPADLYSDHPGTRGNGGPAWVASIVNAIESNPDLWPNTAIIITWDDWGGRYDHVQPMQNTTGACVSYCYGGRVPMLVVSPYTPAMVSDQACDFSCILVFIEHNFGLGRIGDGSYMDAYAAGDLSEYFTGEERPAQLIRSRKLTKQEIESVGVPDTD